MRIVPVDSPRLALTLVIDSKKSVENPIRCSLLSSDVMRTFSTPDSKARDKRFSLSKQCKEWKTIFFTPTYPVQPHAYPIALEPAIPTSPHVSMRMDLANIHFFAAYKQAFIEKKTNFRQKKTAIDTRQPYHTWALVAEVLCLDCCGEIKIGNPNKRNRQIIYLRSILNSTMDKMQTNIRCT